jgi:hypothetical protein
MEISIPYNYVVYDTRTPNDFKGISICGYKRSDVIKEYQNAMINNKLEDAIRWCVELHSTGLNSQILTSLRTIYIRYIHINNPKLFFYLNKREKEYMNIVNGCSKKHEIFTRNDQEIRNLFSELTSISTLTKKNNLFLQKSLPTINQSSFLPENIKKRMISKNTDYIMEYVFNNTNSEVTFALNEILNNLLFKNGTFENCIYWYLWLEKLDSIQKKQINPCGIGSVIFTNKKVDKDIYFDHWIFILWNIFNSFEAKLEKRDFTFIKKLEKIYKNKFKPSQISSKKFYLFIVFYIIKKNINWNIYLFHQEHLILQSVANINKMYGNIISTITNHLSNEQKNILFQNYNILKIGFTQKNKQIKKIKNTSIESSVEISLNQDINKVIPTHYPEYIDMTKQLISEDYNNPNDKHNQHKSNVISKNMNMQDILDEKELRKAKKIQAFTGFVSYKKNSPNSDESNILNDYEHRPKTVISYYENESDTQEIIDDNIKSIDINLKKIRHKEKN